MILSCAGDPYDVGKIDTTSPLPPFTSEAFEPLLSRASLEAHYGQHQKYCANTQRILREWREPELEDATLLEIVMHASRHRDPGGPDDLFSQAGQAWNHAFLWLSFRPYGPGIPRLARVTQDEFGDTALGSLAIRSGFATFAELAGELAEKAASTFGSQWVWLIYVSGPSDGHLDIVVTNGAESPITRPNVTPLLVVDCWEHAFMANYGFDRAKYAKVCVERLLNWDRAESIMALEFCDR